MSNLPKWKLPFKPLLMKNGGLNWRVVTQDQRNKYYQAGIENYNPNIQLKEDAGKAKNPHKVLCATCGHTWKAKLSNLLTGYGCPKCTGQAHDTASVNEKIQKAHGNRISLIGDFSGGIRDVKYPFQCSESHVFHATIDNVSRGRGCPRCKGKNHNVLYLWRLGDTDVYKIGITSVSSGESRINGVAKKHNVTPTILNYKEIPNARDVERQLLQYAKSIGKSTDLVEDGHTEMVELRPEQAELLQLIIEEL